MYNISNDSKMVQCPYNKSHTMPKSALQRHIVKCEKNFGANYRVICPYNATHRLSKSEIAEHIEACPAKKIVEVDHIERYCIPAAPKKEDELSFASIFEDSWEKQIKTFKNTTRFINQNVESERDDVESFVSSAGIGRGRIISNYKTPIKLWLLNKSYNS